MMRQNQVAGRRSQVAGHSIKNRGIFDATLSYGSLVDLEVIR